MNIEATKLELMHLLLLTQKESLLAKIKTIFEEEQVDWSSEMSMEEQEEIKMGLSQADKGYCTPNETVMKRFEKWHRKLFGHYRLKGSWIIHFQKVRNEISRLLTE